MKQSIIFILVLVLSLCLVACHKEETDLEAPVKFYYCTVKTPELQNTRQEAIGWETREGAAYTPDDLEGLLNLYFLGPQTDNLSSLFPKNTKVVSIIQNETALFLELNEAFAALTGIDLSLACACIGFTIFEYTNVQILSIEVQNSLLDGRSSITLLRENLLLNDNTDIPADIG